MKKIIVLLVLCLSMALVGSSKAESATTTPDSLIKGANSSIYYYASDGFRYVFPNDKTFGSWFSDFNSVITVSNDELANIPLKGNITYRPGVRMVKIETSPKVYVVDEGGKLRWIKNEEVAKKLYGDDWNKKIDDIPDVFFMNYKEGKPLEDNKDYTPETVASSVQTINKDRGITETTSTPKSTTGVGSSTIPATPATPHPGDGIPADPATPGGGGGSGAPVTSTSEEKVIICHIPPGNPENKQTITINKSALPAHLAHGDSLGECPAPAVPGDITAPVISNIQATNITQTAANVLWITNEAASSYVYYSKSSAVFTTTTLKEGVSGNVTSHSITLSELFANSTYYYIVVSKDASGNTATSSANTFQTLAEPIVTPTTRVITATAETGGTISPAGSVVVAQGTNKIFTITPNAGYTISTVTVDGVNQGAIGTYTFTNVQTTHTISATFSLIPITQPCLLTVSIASTTPLAQNISPGQSAVSLVKFNATPNCDGTLKSFAVSLLPMPSGYQNIFTLRLYDDVSGAQLGTTQSVTIAGMNFPSVNTPLTANQTLVLKVVGDVSPSAVIGSTVYGVFGGSWAVNSSGRTIGNNASGNLIAGNTMTVAAISIAQYSISVTQGANGAISPETTSVVSSGNQTFTITPVAGYQISSVTVDGINQGAISSYTFTKVTTTHAISALFSVIPTQDPGTNPRIMYWWGKVNQHTDAVGNWLTDPDGISGADLDKLTYCKKFYPNTTGVEDYMLETTDTWRNRGNVDGPFTSIKMSTKCLQPNGVAESIKPSNTNNLAVFSQNLTIGSIGDDVKRLQTLLVEEVGYSANLITGYFGPITREAVKKLQEKYGIKPVSGYFGKITRQSLQVSVDKKTKPIVGEVAGEYIVAEEIK